MFSPDDDDGVFSSCLPSSIKSDIVVSKTMAEPLLCVCKKNSSGFNAGVSHSVVNNILFLYNNLSEKCSDNE